VLQTHCFYNSEVKIRYKAPNILNYISHHITGLDRSLGQQDVEAPRISRQRAHEGGKVISTRHRPPLSPLPPPDEISLVLLDVRG